MEAHEKCVRSYLPHAMIFKGKAGKSFAKPILIPSGTDEKPYVVVSDADLAQLMEEPTFKSGYDQNKLKILPAIPAQFQDLATTLVSLRTDNGDLKAKLQTVEARATTAEAKVAELTDIIEKKLTELDGALTPKGIDELKDRLAAIKEKDK